MSSDPRPLTRGAVHGAPTRDGAVAQFVCSHNLVQILNFTQEETGTQTLICFLKKKKKKKAILHSNHRQLSTRSDLGLSLAETNQQTKKPTNGILAPFFGNSDSTLNQTDV